MNGGQYAELVEYTREKLRFHSGGKETLNHNGCADIVNNIYVQHFDSGLLNLCHMKKKINDHIIYNIHNVHRPTHDMKKLSKKFYADLLGYAKGYLKKKTHIDPSDVVNDVLLECIEKSLPYDLKKMKDMVKNHPSIYERTTKRRGYDFPKFMTEKACKRCQQVLPAACFYIHKLPTTMVLSSNCKECTKIVMKEYSKTEKGKRINRERQARFKKRHEIRSAVARKKDKEKAKKTIIR